MEGERGSRNGAPPTFRIVGMEGYRWKFLREVRMLAKVRMLSTVSKGFQIWVNHSFLPSVLDILATNFSASIPPTRPTIRSATIHPSPRASILEKIFDPAVYLLFTSFSRMNANSPSLKTFHRKRTDRRWIRPMRRVVEREEKRAWSGTQG